MKTCNLSITLLLASCTADHLIAPRGSVVRDAKSPQSHHLYESVNLANCGMMGLNPRKREL